jgi:hypothetical protein
MIFRFTLLARATLFARATGVDAVCVSHSGLPNAARVGLWLTRRR